MHLDIDSTSCIVAEGLVNILHICLRCGVCALKLQSGLLRPTHLKVLSPSLLQQLHAEQQQQEKAAAVVSLLCVKCLLGPPEALPEELLLLLLHTAAAEADTLQPCDVVVCLYTLKRDFQTQQQQVIAVQQELRRKLLQRAAALLPSLLPEELLLLAAAAEEDWPAELLQQAFECMYSAIPFYTPHQLATVSCKRSAVFMCCFLG